MSQHWERPSVLRFYEADTPDDTCFNDPEFWAYDIETAKHTGELCAFDGGLTARWMLSTGETVEQYQRRIGIKRV